MPVEARSLADITRLACNPPPRPAPPTLSHINAITLYIVRVPGRRDVFLTPLKPRDRVVNAQDVQSSLYYLHVDSLDDQVLRASTSPTTETANPTDERKPRSLAGTVRRKPLPTPPTSPADAGRGESPSSPRQSWSSLPARKPLLPARPTHRSSVSSIGSIATRHDTDDLGQKFILIRRNPASGEQWNVARIHDPPVDEISSTASKENHGLTRRKNPGAPIYLDIESEGYACFAATDEAAFKRRMWMDGSRHADHNYPHQLSVVDRRNKGYAFVDVWGQKCSFSTGNTGRALKCRREDAAHGSSGIERAEISELRFNLPTLHLASKSDPSHGRSDHSTFGPVPHHSSDSDHSLDTGQVDNSLGRERAGGGFGGREA